MPKVVLAHALARWLEKPAAVETAIDVGGDTVGNVLNEVFARHPGLRGYVVDERGAVRHHVAIFVDGVAIADKTQLTYPVAPRGEVYIMQALSGG